TAGHELGARVRGKRGSGRRRRRSAGQRKEQQREHEQKRGYSVSFSHLIFSRSPTPRPAFAASAMWVAERRFPEGIPAMGGRLRFLRYPSTICRIAVSQVTGSVVARIWLLATL